MSYCHGLGREMAAEKIPRNTVGMVWKKEHKLACVSLHHVHRKYGYGIRGNWYLNFQKSFQDPSLFHLPCLLHPFIATQPSTNHYPLPFRVGNLPTERLKPAPPWSSTGIDLFGPYKIRDEVKKRTTSKAYGVIFNCLGTRAVYLDIAADYSTDKFLMVFTAKKAFF